MTIAPTSRIFCIGRNYAAHIAELGSSPSEKCVIFMKPPSCIVPEGQKVSLPRELGEVHHEAELVVKIGVGGSFIPREAALEHLSGVTLGLDLTLRQLQSRLKEKGLPWELAKAFDQSAPLGEIVPYEMGAGPGLDNLKFTCVVNGELRQEGDTSQMLFPVERLIEILSTHWKLMPGDLVFTGTPAGVGPVQPGDLITLESPDIGSFSWEFE